MEPITRSQIAFIDPTSRGVYTLRHWSSCRRPSLKKKNHLLSVNKETRDAPVASDGSCSPTEPRGAEQTFVLEFKKRKTRVLHKNNTQ